MSHSLSSRPNLDELVSDMKALGATEVVTEEFAASHKMKQLMTVSICCMVRAEFSKAQICADEILKFHLHHIFTDQA